MYWIMRSSFLSLVLPVALGCATGRIPNTDVADTSENRSVVAFCERYRHAVEQRDARVLLSLASPRYFEDGGTPAGDDDYGYDGLQRLLNAWSEDVQQVRYEMRYRRISVDPQNPARIHVDYTFTGSYTLRAPAVSLGAPGDEEREPALQIDPVRGATRDEQDREVWFRRVADNRLEIERNGTEFRILSGM
jgi:hypothetical protein